MISFTVPGKPIPQPRQRHAVHGDLAVNYTPRDHPVHAYKACVALAARSAMARIKLLPLVGPVVVQLTFVLPRPKKFGPLSDQGRVPCDKRPDNDNYQKSLLDSLSGVTFKDDGQVFRMTAEKWYAATGEAPCTVVSVGPFVECNPGPRLEG